MKKKIVFLFSGQGSHYYQMGRTLFNEDKIFRHWMLTGNELITQLAGIDVLNEVYYKNYKVSDLFNRTLYTHPAIFLIEYSLYQVLLERGLIPDYVLGTSLGELTAATVSGALSFEEALFAVIKQAELLEKYCLPGGMLAVLHSHSLFQEKNINTFSELAAVNFDAHFIVSGLEENLKIIQNILQKENIVSQRLAISQAFHSSHIDSTKEVYCNTIKHLSFKAERIPWISGGQVKRHSIQYLWDIIRLPILFQSTIQSLEQNGHYLYIDLGPSGTLANFVKYNLKSNSHSQAVAILTPFGSQINRLSEVI